jgi:anti-sigma B factor antagonist
MAERQPHLVEQTQTAPSRGIASRSPDELLSIRVCDEATGIRVTLAGELDLSTAAAFDQQLWEAQRHARRVVLDLRALEFIDSAGLRSVFGAWLRASEAHQPLEMTCTTNQVRRMLSLSGLDQLETIRRPVPIQTPRAHPTAA